MFKIFFLNIFIAVKQHTHDSIPLYAVLNLKNGPILQTVLELQCNYNYPNVKYLAHWIDKFTKKDSH